MVGEACPTGRGRARRCWRCTCARCASASAQGARKAAQKSGSLQPMPTCPSALRTGSFWPSGQTQKFSVYGPFSLPRQSAKLSRRAFCCCGGQLRGAERAAGGAAPASVSRTRATANSVRAIVSAHRILPAPGAAYAIDAGPSNGPRRHCGAPFGKRCVSGPAAGCAVVRAPSLHPRCVAARAGGARRAGRARDYLASIRAVARAAGVPRPHRRRAARGRPGAAPRRRCASRCSISAHAEPPRLAQRHGDGADLPGERRQVRLPDGGVRVAGAGHAAASTPSSTTCSTQ